MILDDPDLNVPPFVLFGSTTDGFGIERSEVKGRFGDLLKVKSDFDLGPRWCSRPSPKEFGEEESW